MPDPDPAEPQPRVLCPACGKRFRVDPAAVAGRARGIPARCTRCGGTFRVRLGAQGAIEVVPREETSGRASTPARKTRPPAGSGRRRKAPRRRPSEAPAAGDEPRVEAAPIGMGERVGRYEVEELLGRGGMAAVYRAFDPAANRHIALKVLSADAPEDNVARFQREVQVQGNIQHPHILPIFDSGTIGRSHYFAMELLKDPLSLASLARLVREGHAARDPLLRPVSTLEGIVRRVVLPVCEAIHHANVHEGVIHRDLKPDNVLLDRNGLRPFVIDFGVCSLIERQNQRLAHLPPETPARLAGGGVRVTGTLVYMSPEQAHGQVDRRGDVWALGAILHFLVSGAPPYAPASRASVSTADRIEGLNLLAEQSARAGREQEAALFRRKVHELAAGSERSVEALQRDVLSGRALPLPPRTPLALQAIIARAMAPEPEQRYRHALDLGDDLRAWLEGRAVRALLRQMDPVRAVLYRGATALRRHRGMIALLLLVGGIGAGVLWSALHPSPSPTAEPAAMRLARAVAAQDASAADGEVERLARAALSDPSTADEALAILDEVGRRARLREALDRGEVLARAAVAAFAAGHDEEGYATLARLAETLEARIAPLRQGSAAAASAHEVAALEAVVRAERPLVVTGTEDGVLLEAFPLEGPGGRVRWDSGRPAASLPLGSWVVAVRRGAGEVLLPVRVVPGGGALAVPCPIDPGRVPTACVYVPGGRIECALGTADVPALVWDRTEVSAERYARFLDRLEPDERTRRVPRSAGWLGAPATPRWERVGDRFVPPLGGLRRPVEGISVHDAQAFARAEGARLPTALEWVWAARGGDRRLTPLGGLEVLEGLDLRLARPGDGPADVGGTPADRNPFGLHDLAGGVAEMTATMAPFRGTTGWWVLGGGYATSLARVLLTEAEPVPGWEPQAGAGFRLVRAP